MKRQAWSTHSDVLVGVVHHGDEHVEQHHQGDDVVGAEHGGAHELGELVVCVHVGDVQVDQAEDGPEQRLQGLEQPAEETGCSVLFWSRRVSRLLSMHTHARTHAHTHTH